MNPLATHCAPVDHVLLFSSKIPNLCFQFLPPRVLQESLCAVNLASSPASDDDDGGFKYIDPDLALALRLSQQDQQQYELERKREQEMIEQALKLSLQEH